METFKQHMIYTRTHKLANIGWGIEGSVDRGVHSNIQGKDFLFRILRGREDSEEKGKIIGQQDRMISDLKCMES